MPLLNERKDKSVNITLTTGFIVLSVMVIMCVTCAIAALSYKSISSLSSINLLGIQKNQELKQLDNLVGQVHELHSNVRDYVITGDSTYLAVAHSNREKVLNLTKPFSDSLAEDEPRENMVLLSSLIARKVAFNDNILKLYKVGGREIALEFIETGKPGILTDSIALIAGNIKSFENHELESSVEKYDSAANQTRITILVASGLIILLGFAFMFTTMYNLQHRATIMAELEKAKSASEKAALLKSQFVSNMSHEIRTPLNSIIGFTNILSKTKMDSEQEDFVQTIKNASENLLNIVNDVLDFSKIEAGMMRLDAHEFSIDELFENLRKLFEHSAMQNRLRLEFRCDESVPLKCVGDGNRLYQILVNLIGNAIKFTERGSVTVRLRATEIVDDYAVLEFKVKDTGVGIARDKLPRIFDRFEQIDNNATRKHPGTGLGLSIVRSLVELEGGAIRVSSIVGEGTEFVFTVKYLLPVGKTASQAPVETAETETVKTLVALKGKVLVVEDNPVNQKLAAFILKKWNIDFDIAPNGVVACNMLKNATYDLVLMDIQMPEMDGYQATRVIREEMKLQVPIVALTAHAFEGEIERFTKAGMNGRLTKPFKEEDLHKILSDYLKVGDITNESQPLAKAAENGKRRFNQVIDFSEVEKISGGNKIFVKELAETFLTQIQDELNQLNEAYLRRDLKNMKAIAHSMKSTVGYMGLIDKLEKALSRIENSVEDDLSGGDLLQDMNYVKTICINAVKQLEVELPAYV